MPTPLFLASIHLSSRTVSPRDHNLCIQNFPSIIICFHIFTEHITLKLLSTASTTNGMYHITTLSLTVSLLGFVAATGNLVHRYAQLRAWGQPGCRASNLGEAGIYGDYIGSCEPLDNYDMVRSVSVEAVESGCTRTSRQLLDCALPLTNLQCTFTAICSVIPNGSRLLLTNASVANTSIRCTN